MVAFCWVATPGWLLHQACPCWSPPTSCAGFTDTHTCPLPRLQLGEATKLITGLQDKVAKLTNANKLLAMGVPQISQSYR